MVCPLGSLILIALFDIVGAYAKITAGRGTLQGRAKSHNWDPCRNHTFCWVYLEQHQKNMSEENYAEYQKPQWEKGKKNKS